MPNQQFAYKFHRINSKNMYMCIFIEWKQSYARLSYLDEMVRLGCIGCDLNIEFAFSLDQNNSINDQTYRSCMWNAIAVLLLPRHSLKF